MSKSKNYRDMFSIPGIDFQLFPVYALDHNGRIVNFKDKVYPNPRSVRRYTRAKQLKNRSRQALIFDALIGIGYFEGLGTIVKEMPILIQNSYRPVDLRSGLYFLCDYYFANIKLAVELDSEYHDSKEDALRDKYLSDAYGIKTFRMEHLELDRVQRGRFQELKSLLKSYVDIPSVPVPLDFTKDLFERY